MNKLWTNFKTNMKLNFRQLPQILGIFIGMPLVLSLFIGFSYTSLFQPDISFDPVDVSIQNEDSSDLSTILVDTMENQDDLFNSVDQEEAEFEITIGEGYSENIEDTLVSIEASDDASSTNQEIVRSFITSFQEIMSEQLQLSQEIDENLNQEQTIQLAEDLDFSNAIIENTEFETQTFESSLAITSTQSASIAGITFILLMTMSSAVGLKEDRFKGLSKRMEIAPLKAYQSILYPYITDVLFYTAVVSLYVGIWKIIDQETFLGNPLFYLFWIFIYTGLVFALNSVIDEIFGQSLSSTIYVSLNILVVMLVMLPIDRMVGNAFPALASILERNIFKQIFVDPMITYIQTGKILAYLPLAGVLVVISFTLLAFTIIYKKRKVFQS